MQGISTVLVIIIGKTSRVEAGAIILIYEAVYLTDARAVVGPLLTGGSITLCFQSESVRKLTWGGHGIRIIILR